MDKHRSGVKRTAALSVHQQARHARDAKERASGELAPRGARSNASLAAFTRYHSPLFGEFPYLGWSCRRRTSAPRIGSRTSYGLSTSNSPTLFFGKAIGHDSSRDKTGLRCPLKPAHHPKPAISPVSAKGAQAFYNTVTPTFIRRLNAIYAQFPSPRATVDTEAQPFSHFAYSCSSRERLVHEPSKQTDS